MQDRFTDTLTKLSEHVIKASLEEYGSDATGYLSHWERDMPHAGMVWVINIQYGDYPFIVAMRMKSRDPWMDRFGVRTIRDVDDGNFLVRVGIVCTSSSDVAGTVQNLSVAAQFMIGPFPDCEPMMRWYSL